MFGLSPWKRKEVAALEPETGRDFWPRRLDDPFSNLFDRVFGQLPDLFRSDWSGPQMFWEMNLEDTDKELIVHAEAPGFENEDFDIQVSGNMLTIRAQHKSETKDETGQTVSERQFQRSVMLPVGAEPEQISAKYRNGMLEVHVPKTAAAQAKRIEVKT